MKTLVLTLAGLMFAATTVFAYVQPGALPRAPSPNAPVVAPSSVGHPTSAMGLWGGPRIPGRGAGQRAGGEPVPGGGATNPVPEPGTIFLVSFGLIALGAAVRRNRSSS
jgi:hypothetical protein